MYNLCVTSHENNHKPSLFLLRVQSTSHIISFPALPPSKRFTADFTCQLKKKKNYLLRSTLVVICTVIWSIILLRYSTCNESWLLLVLYVFCISNDCVILMSLGCCVSYLPKHLRNFCHTHETMYYWRLWYNQQFHFYPPCCFLNYAYFKERKKRL